MHLSLGPDFNNAPTTNKKAPHSGLGIPEAIILPTVGLSFSFLLYQTKPSIRRKRRMQMSLRFARRLQNRYCCYRGKMIDGLRPYKVRVMYYSGGFFFITKCVQWRVKTH